MKQKGTRKGCPYKYGGETFEMNPEDQLPAQYFRAGAGALIINDQGLVLALERSDVPRSWQLPQGGLQQDETPEQAVYREILEETGIPDRDLELLESFPGPLVYELPKRLRTERTGRGQALYWFLFRFQARDGELQFPTKGEFLTWKWIRFRWLLEKTAQFRQPVYEQLAGHWNRYLR